MSGSNNVDVLQIPLSLHPRAVSRRLLDAGENLLERLRKHYYMLSML